MASHSTSVMHLSYCRAEKLGVSSADRNPVQLHVLFPVHCWGHGTAPEVASGRCDKCIQNSN